MTSSVTDLSLRKASLIGGFSLLIISILAPVGHYALIQDLIVLGDASATVNRIIASEGLFRIGICCLLINAVLDLVVAWALFLVLKPVNRSVSLLSAWFRVVYTAILVVSLSNFVNALQILSSVDYLAAYEPNQLYAQVMLLIDSFDNVWNLGYVIFGVHLTILGYLLLNLDIFLHF